MYDWDAHTARRVIHSLGESGLPPTLAARRLNVGTERMLDRLREEYLDRNGLCARFNGQDGTGICRWVVANYGNGKTHFLRCVQEMAWELGYVTAFVELSQDECPLDRMDRVFSAVARTIQARPMNAAEVDRTRGFDIALSQLLDRFFPGVLSSLGEKDLRLQAASWIQTTFMNIPVESTSLRDVAGRFLLARLEGDDETARIGATYLRGEPVAAANMRLIGANEKLDRSNGFRFLRTVCQLLQRSELATGTVLLFDEARRTLSLMTSRSQKMACENLLSVINRCNAGELPGTMFLYGVMPEFFWNFSPQYPALHQRCGANTRIQLDELTDIKEEDLLTVIGKRITDVFRVAYPGAVLNQQVLESDLKLMVFHALRDLSGTGTRRLFVRGWVQILRDLQDGRTTPLDAEGINRLLDGVREQCRNMEVDAVNSEGE